jgi:RNA polymerase sigma-70 factor, ECF subfamily
VSAVETRADTAACAEEETARLFEAHSAELLGYCRRHLPSGADAEDALQTTFLYALRALGRGIEPECETAWLTAIAKNVCFTQLRTLGRRGPVAADVELDRIALAEPEPETDFLAALPGALAALPENQRNALVMREWLGLGAGEIAERLELTPTATSALLTRARRSLARGLAPAVRPRSALNLGVLLDLVRAHVRALLGGAGLKAAAGVVVASVAVGGVVAERSFEPATPRPSRPAPANPGPQVQAAGPDSAGRVVASRRVTVAPATRGSVRRSTRGVAAQVTPAATAWPAGTDDARTGTPRAEPSSSLSTPAATAERHQLSMPPPSVIDKTVVPPLPVLPSAPVAVPSAPPAIEVPVLPVLSSPDVPMDAPHGPPLPSLP